MLDESRQDSVILEHGCSQDEKLVIQIKQFCSFLSVVFADTLWVGLMAGLPLFWKPGCVREFS